MRVADAVLGIDLRTYMLKHGHPACEGTRPLSPPASLTTTTRDVGSDNGR